MKKFTRMIIFALFLCVFAADALAESGFLSVPDVVRPGRGNFFSFYLDRADEVTITVLDAENNVVDVICEDEKLIRGENVGAWVGTGEKGIAFPEGVYTIRMEGHHVYDEAELIVGKEAPRVRPQNAPYTVYSDDEWTVQLQMNMPGVLSVGLTDAFEREYLMPDVQVEAGIYHWNGSELLKEIMLPGVYRISWKLTDETGIYTSTVMDVEIKQKKIQTEQNEPEETKEKGKPASYAVPNETLNYWTLSYNEMDESKIWQAMTEPMMVIKGFRGRYPIRRTPDASIAEENIAGEVAVGTQGLHVLLHLDNGWSMVEAYNAAAGYDKTDELICGYVETKELQTVIPDDEYGLLVDKLEQRMYVFRQGKCIGSLKIATGRHNTETVSGEYVTKDSFFQKEDECQNIENMLLITDRLVIHTLPYEVGLTENGEEKRWNEYRLGGKTTDGCIWVGKEENEDGLNMQWLCENVPVNTKVMIWDDTARKFHGMELYYNPMGGRFYHSTAFCPSVSEIYQPLTAFPVEEMDSPKFIHLSPCADCVENSQMYKKTKWDPAD